VAITKKVFLRLLSSLETICPELRSIECGFPSFSITWRRRLLHFCSLKEFSFFVVPTSRHHSMISLPEPRHPSKRSGLSFLSPCGCGGSRTTSIFRNPIEVEAFFPALALAFGKKASERRKTCLFGRKIQGREKTEWAKRPQKGIDSKKSEE